MATWAVCQGLRTTCGRAHSHSGNSQTNNINNIKEMFCLWDFTEGKKHPGVNC